MKVDIERVKISTQGRQQLIQIKRKTGILQYNVICRYALILSLTEKSLPPEERFDMSRGIEIDWKTFCSGLTDIYTNLLIERCLQDRIEINQENVKKNLLLHIHRGLSYIFSNPNMLLHLLNGK